MEKTDQKEYRDYDSECPEVKTTDVFAVTILNDSRFSSLCL
jgi:hypothetical protein